MNTRRQNSDYILSLIIFALIAFGLIMIYSVSKYYSMQITDGATDKYFLKQQIISFVLALTFWVIFQSIDYKFWQKHTTTMFFLTLIFLILPALLGGSNGKRWIGLGGRQFQPSEAAKLTFIFYLAGWFINTKGNLAEIKQKFFPFLAVMGTIAFLMLIQKDLGTLSIFIIIGAVIFFIAGATVNQILASGGLTALLLWLAVKLEPYRLERILTFLDPEKNLLDTGYHIRNALIAVGSGGLFGLGFGQSRQKYLYLPEAHTDSIFAITAEELGFVRSIFLVLAFTLIALRGYRIALRAPDAYSRLLASGITTWIIAQAFINIAAMLSMVPLTGIPMPFVSFGGSSLILLLAGVGVLTNISKHVDR